MMNRSLSFLICFLMPFALLAQTKQLAVEDLMNPKLSQKYLSNVQWLPDSDDCSWISNNSLLKASYKSGKTSAKDTLVRLAELNKSLEVLKIEALKRFPSVTWKDNNSFTFILKNKLLKYAVSPSTSEVLNTWDENAENTDIHPGNGNMAYTLENNLFLSVNGKTVKVTVDTDKGIVNGSSKVHRNEWGIEKGTFWSPSGNKLAFYRMDETMVADYPMVNIDNPIATVENTKYPMTGQTSHQVSLGVYDLKNGKTVFLNTGEPKDQYLTNICWTPDEKYILVAILNRGQNHLWMKQYDALTGAFVKTLFEETDTRYVEPMNPPVFLKKNADRFIWQIRRDGYNHLYLYDMTGKLLNQITRGNWEVTSFIGTNIKEDKVYFMAVKETPLEKQLYEAVISDGKIKRLTANGFNHNAFVNKNSGLFIDQAGAVDVPLHYYVQNSKGVVIDTLLKGENPLKDYKLGKTTLLTLQAEDGSDLHARLIKPVDFDPSKKYPVVIYVYGGPHSQLVTNSWLGGAGLYLNYLASQGYLVFTLDNRGTSNRGFAFESCIHRQLGELEVKDQMVGVKFMKNLPYVDSTRMAVEGWSYGGFMTISMMLKNPGVFKVGTCGGPVIDWKYYEVMYGERYMDTPQENPDGYAKSSLLNYAKHLQGRLLVIHGTVDPTVVWQNSLQFIKQCITEGVQIDYFVYPGHEHGVGGKDRLHLMKKQIQYYQDFL
ncbi:MAG: DPP IV N-terminal domain-containing protein [Bacteroidales bacterium]